MTALCPRGDGIQKLFHHLCKRQLRQTSCNTNSLVTQVSVTHAAVCASAATSQQSYFPADIDLLLLEVKTALASNTPE